jgi:hypothetical protein
VHIMILVVDSGVGRRVGRGADLDGQTQRPPRRY